MDKDLYNESEFEEESYSPEEEDSVDSEDNSESEEVLDEPEESENDEVEEKKKLKTRAYIRNLKRKTERALNEAQVLRDQLEHYQETSGNLNSSVYAQFEENARLRIKNAQMVYKNALEDSDSDALAVANEELMRSTASLEMIKLESARQNAIHQNNYQQPRYEEPQQKQVDQRVERWVEQNSWFDPDDPDFDRQKAVEVDAYAARLNDNLINQGLEYEINTPSYFAKINRYASHYDQENYSGNRQMKTHKSPVSSVRNVSSGFNAQKSKAQIKLTPEEKEFIRLNHPVNGVTEESFLKAKIKSREEDRIRGRI